MANAMPDLRYLPSLGASPPFGQYQMILLGEQQHVCEQLAKDCYYLTVPRLGVDPGTSRFCIFVFCVSVKVKLSVYCKVQTYRSIIVFVCILPEKVVPEMT